MLRRFFSIAVLVACAGCTQSSAPPTTPSATTTISVAESEATVPVADVPATDLPPSDEKTPADKPAADQIVEAPTTEPSAAAIQPRTAAKPVVAEYSANVPAVQMSVAECSECTVTIGDALPPIKLPKLDGGEADLASLAGKQATVVVFWGADRWMSNTALADLQKDVAASPQSQSVAVVGVAVGQKPDAVAAAIEKSTARFPQLLDVDGQAFSELGAAALPRVYVLDAAGKIAWFDIEYSEATRRDLRGALAALTALKP